MEEKRYMISDTSRMLGIESHVLRYWEEELDIVIPRNEMGHRYYTEFHINLLRNVKKLKQQGYGLRAIKMMISDPNKEIHPEYVFSACIILSLVPMLCFAFFQKYLVQGIATAGIKG